MRNPLSLFPAALLLFLSGSAMAEDASPTELARSLHYQKGHFDIAGGVVQIDVGDPYAYLSPEDATILLTKIWGNPPDAASGIEGMIVPTDVDLESNEGWAVVLDYENSGHVTDSDAASINYDDLLRDMQKTTIEGNDARVKAGYEPIQLLGWAEPPHYDSAHKTVYWARRLRFGEQQDETINYNMRVLGRTGVLDMDVIAGASQLPMVNAKAPALMSIATFKPGSLYSDYRAGSDHTAAYGVAGLIAGGVLVKAGFLKGLIALLAASWKIIAIAGVALFGAIGAKLKSIFRRTG
jgi:uncharacterized membrane-anchored protein